MLNKIEAAFSDSYRDDKVRRRLMFQILNILLSMVAFTMSIMNLATEEQALFWITASYTALCVANYFLVSKHFILAQALFFIETIFMMGVFIVTGIPAGFSLLWTLLVPACALAIFGIQVGSIFSAALFLVIIFFFWFPLGRSLLQYPYSATYMLRFPMVYICIYLISLYVEWIRRKTYDRLIVTEERNRWLYRHDALTGAYSRHAFSEELDRVLQEESSGTVCAIMIDIDDFKHINDTYGHNTGDAILCRLAQIIRDCTCRHSLSCRWGGEEFLIIMGCHHDAIEVAESIRRKVEQTELSMDDGVPVSFTVSAGVARSEIRDRQQIPQHIDRADKALYAAKSAGKNRVVCYNSIAAEV